MLILAAGCTSIAPKPVTDREMSAQTVADRAASQKEVEPVKGPMTLEQAMARALKFNLDRRTKLMEEAIALNQLDVAKLDMLPKLTAQSGFASRDNDRTNLSRNITTGALAPNNFISQDRSHVVSQLGLTWNMLEMGVGYLGTLQAADRMLIATEKRRKAMHVLMQDVRTVYWRAVSAQKLKDEVKRIIALAEEALVDSRKSESERVRNPLDALRYQRQILENLRLLESIEQELASAQVELTNLVNVPIGTQLVLVDMPVSGSSDALKVPLEKLEETALLNNADLREQHYNARIARTETRKVLYRLFPNISFNYGVNYDTDSFLVNQRWNEAGLQVSYNLLNFLTAGTQKKYAEAGVALADQRRVAVQVAVLTQIHLARLQLVNAIGQFARADEIWNVDNKISTIVINREAARAQSKLERISNETAAVLSLLRRYQAAAQMQAAESRLQAGLGLEPAIPGIDVISTDELAQKITLHNLIWQSMVTQPAPPTQKTQVKEEQKK
ncbi:MAG: nodT [Paucimonas sp.]|nr:nodT [Paucimonas sp.]